MEERVSQSSWLLNAKYILLARFSACNFLTFSICKIPSSICLFVSHNGVWGNLTSEMESSVNATTKRYSVHAARNLTTPSVFFVDFNFAYRLVKMSALNIHCISAKPPSYWFLRLKSCTLKCRYTPPTVGGIKQCWDAGSFRLSVYLSVPSLPRCVILL